MPSAGLQIRRSCAERAEHQLHRVSQPSSSAAPIAARKHAGRRDLVRRYRRTREGGCRAPRPGAAARGNRPSVRFAVCFGHRQFPCMRSVTIKQARAGQMPISRPVPASAHTPRRVCLAAWRVRRSPRRWRSCPAGRKSSLHRLRPARDFGFQGLDPGGNCSSSRGFLVAELVPADSAARASASRRGWV
jgi:hypothetical protein